MCTIKENGRTNQTPLLLIVQMALTGYSTAHATQTVCIGYSTVLYTFFIFFKRHASRLLISISLTFSLCTPFPGSCVLLQTHGYFVSTKEQKPLANAASAPAQCAPKQWKLLPSDIRHIQSSSPRGFKTASVKTDSPPQTS